MRPVELLAPGGDPLAVKAAILAGADAVYLGVGECNARKRATNIREEELAGLCRIAHSRGCRIYLTLNILVYEPELPDLLRLLHHATAAGIDAVIVQDLGLVQLVHELFPGLEIHASTQLTTHNPGQLAFLKPWGIRQVNLSRELSLAETRELAAAAHQSGMRAEVFVHGAFCVSFSGQCYFSGQLHDNPANRGACVQPCRRTCVTENGATVLPFNLKDNSLYAAAGELTAAGVDAFKIEGRIKGFEYVYAVVTAWREQLDRIQAGKKPEDDDPRLAAVFNRGFSDNLLRGRLGKSSFAPSSSDASLQEAGIVAGYHADRKELSLEPGGALQPGSQISIRREDGSFVCTGTAAPGPAIDRWLFQIEHELKGKILPGQRVFSQSLPEEMRDLQHRLAAFIIAETKIPLALKLSGAAGQPLSLQATAFGRTAAAVSAAVLEPATSRPTDHETIRERLGKLGGTPFRLDACDLSGLADNLFIPLKLPGELRREAVARLVPEQPPVPELPRLTAAPPVTVQRLAVLVREPAQLAGLPRDGSVIICYQLPAHPAAPEGMGAFFNGNPDLVPWFPPILIGEDYTTAVILLETVRPALLVTENTGIAARAEALGLPWIAGPALNATNGYALRAFRTRGAQGAFPGPDTGSGQLASMTVAVGIALWGMLLGPRILMRSRHCLVRNCSDCGKEFMDARCLPDCDRHASLRDTQQHTLLVVKKPGEYSTVYGGSLSWQPQLIGHPRHAVLLLDLRAPHPALQPPLPAPELLDLARRAVCNRDPAARAALGNGLQHLASPGYTSG